MNYKNVLNWIALSFITLILNACGNGTCNTQLEISPTLNPANGGVTNGESNVTLAPKIVISFPVTMNADTINSSTIFLSTTPNINLQTSSNNNSNIIPISSIVASNNNTTFSFSAANPPLAQNTTFYITVTNAVKTATNISINQAQFSFITGTFATPTATIVNPINSESQVATKPNIQITFTESVQNVSVNTIKLYAVNLNGPVTLISNITSPSANTYQFTPAVNLNYNTTYYLVLESGITGVNYNPIVQTAFNFTTIQQVVNKTWISGSQNTNQAGIYGTKGIPDANNAPGSRYLSARWTDKNGNLWMFGGYGEDSVSSIDYLNDLWKYDTTTHQWTWVAGSTTTDQSGTYGTLGTPSVNNIPGARSGAMKWNDAQGNLWLFGGYGYDSNGNYGYLNDLWKFNPTSQEWTWVNGSNTINQQGNYGTKGAPSAQNIVGARDSAVTWTDFNGKLWLFGGCQGNNGGQCSDINDLWQYNISTNQWTWMGGNNTVQQGGQYGTLGVPSIDNLPTPRDTSTGWVDLNGNFWLFGGYNFPTGGSRNDLWRYNTTTGEWTWMSGSNAAGQIGIYGTKMVESTTNIPGAREDSASWIDANGNFWLFGGDGYDKNGNTGYLNDFWKYNPLTNTWTWMSGNGVVNMQTLYGTQGTVSPSNSIGGREDSAIWTDSNGNFWLFGGNGYGVQPWPSQGYLNDIWLINIQ